MTTTSYKLISSYEDRRAAELFFEENDVEHEDLKFPSVIARRGSEVIGVLATLPSDRGVVAGPIHVKVNGNSAFVFKNLVTAYERVLQSTGVTMYNFYVKKDEKEYLDILNKLPHVFERFAEGEEDGGSIWFKRML